jgi:hypothetical protein
MFKLLITTIATNRYIQAPSIAVNVGMAASIVGVATSIVDFETKQEAEYALMRVNSYDNPDDIMQWGRRLY